MQKLTRKQAEYSFEGKHDLFKQDVYSLVYVNSETDTIEEMTFKVEEDIDESPETLKMIKKKYPNSNAKGLIAFRSSFEVRILNKEY